MHVTAHSLMKGTNSMPDFLELIAAMTEANPDLALDELLTAHDDELSSYQAKIDTLTQESTEAAANSEATIMSLKTQNYDLLMAAGSVIEPSDNAGGGTGDDVTETPENVTLDSVFTERD